MIARRIATLGGIGHAPVAPGTWASLATLPLGWALHGLGGFPLLAAATVGLFALGLWACREVQGDPAEVVIDEVVGMLIALWPLSLGMWLREAEPWIFPWPGWVAGFVLFRAFDIAKPFPVNRAERLPGALGIMADDVVAGLFAALCVVGLAAIAHGVLMR